MQVLEIELKQGEEIPLHDHPDTSVFMRVITGKLKVDFYQYQRDSQKKIVVADSQFLMHKGDHAFITPEGINLHRILALQDSCFMDVMSPGYLEHDNPPIWLEIKSEKAGELHLEPMPQPEHIAQAKAQALKALEFNT